MIYDSHDTNAEIFNFIMMNLQRIITTYENKVKLLCFNYIFDDEETFIE